MFWTPCPKAIYREIIYTYIYFTILGYYIVKQLRHKRCSQRNRQVANWLDKCCPINVTQAHRHHTMECRCSSFGTVFAVNKVVPVRVLISVKFNYMYFMTLLWGKNEIQVKFEKSMHNYNATLVHWHQTLGCQCSTKTLLMNGQTEIINLIVWLVICNLPKKPVSLELSYTFTVIQYSS